MLTDDYFFDALLRINIEVVSDVYRGDRPALKDRIDQIRVLRRRPHGWSLVPRIQFELIGSLDVD
jgi:hypothetical protein